MRRENGEGQGMPECLSVPPPPSCPEPTQESSRDCAYFWGPPICPCSAGIWNWAGGSPFLHCSAADLEWASHSHLDEEDQGHQQSHQQQGGTPGREAGPWRGRAVRGYLAPDFIPSPPSLFPVSVP